MPSGNDRATAEEILHDFERMSLEERSGMLQALIATWCPDCGDTHEECLCEDDDDDGEESLAEDDG